MTDTGTTNYTENSVLVSNRLFHILIHTIRSTSVLILSSKQARIQGGVYIGVMPLPQILKQKTKK
jgi:hypothetical protein